MHVFRLIAWLEVREVILQLFAEAAVSESKAKTHNVVFVIFALHLFFISNGLLEGKTCKGVATCHTFKKIKSVCL